jgi:membrane-bound acyltransferase YfiQ involved in biofilm formation
VKNKLLNLTFLASIIFINSLIFITISIYGNNKMDVYIPLAALFIAISFYIIDGKYFPFLEATIVFGGFIVACFIPYATDEKRHLGAFRNDVYLQMLYACIATGIMAFIAKFMRRCSTSNALAHKILFGCYIASLAAFAMILPWQSMLR